MVGGRKFGRRAVLLGAAVLSLGGCGFHPLYATASDGSTGPVATELSQISVDLIPERAGQLLRQALQAHFEGSSLPVAHRYDLAVSFGITGDAIAIQQDTSNARNRYIGIARYTLRAQDPAHTILTTGMARTVDGMTLFDQQLFAAELESEVVQQRIAQAVADEITRQLAAWFDQHATLASAKAP